MPDYQRAYQENKNRVQQEVRQELARRARSGAIIYALCVAVTAVVTELYAGYALVFQLSFLGLLGFGLLRLWLGTRCSDTVTWDQAFAFACVATGTIWSLFVAYLVFSEGLQSSTFLLLTISTGLCAGATSAFAPDLKMLRLVQASLMTPILGGVFALGTPEALGTGIFCILYSGYLIFQGSTMNRGYLLTIVSQIRLEVQTRQLEEARRTAEEANRVKGEFLANVSHEIRTPLNGVIGMTEEVLATSLTELQRQDLGVVRDSAVSLLAVINQILEFSRIEAGQTPAPVQETFSVDHLLANLLRAFSRESDQKGLWLGYQIERDLPTRMVGDPHRLRQILNNLVGNSLKFTLQGRVVVRVFRGQKGPVFEVVDTGVGIPQAYLDRLFEPFTQGDSSLTRRHQGTGLGLSIVRHLARGLGGDVEVFTAPGQGTTFRFECGALVSQGLSEKPLEGRRFCVCDPVSERAELLEQLVLRWGGELSTADGFGGNVTLLVDGERPAGLESYSTIWLYRGVAPVSSLDEKKAWLHTPPTAELLSACLAPVPKTDGGEDAVSLCHQRILVVEDQPVNAELVRRVLERAGHVVTLVDNGAEALEAFAKQAFDLILMDVQMPVMDGYEATARLRATPGGEQVPIIAVTAHAVKGDVERCLAAGMTAYISKPIARAELLRLVVKYSQQAQQTH